MNTSNSDVIIDYKWRIQSAITSSPTNQLRWEQRLCERHIHQPLGYTTITETVPILQQKWMRSDGSVEWIDVPTVPLDQK